MPIASSFLLSSKKGKEAFIEPIVDRQAKTISYRIIYGGTKEQHAAAKTGTKAKRVHISLVYYLAPPLNLIMSRPVGAMGK